MSTTYPSSVDNLVNPPPGNNTTNPSHSAQHTNANDAIEAIETYLGTTTATDPASITGRVVALEAGGGGGGGGDATSVDGWSVEVVATLPAVQDPNTIYFVEGGGGGGSTAWADITGTPTTLGGYGITDAVTLDTAQLITGAKRFNVIVTFEGSTNPLSLGTIGVQADPNSSTGDVMIVDSDEGVQVSGPYVVLDTANLQITMPGAQTNAALTVAGIDAFGVVSLGYTTLPAPSYSVTDTTAIPVVIKAANASVPTAWVFTGLNVTLGQAIAAGTGNIAFEGIFENPTTRTGTVEFGLRVNGGAVIARDIVTQISADFLQTIAMAFPLLNGYANGDLLEIMARVTVNSNNQFSLTMANSASDLGAMRVSTAGGGGGGGTATLAEAVVDNGVGAQLKFWFGTESAYTAIVTKDPTTVYLRSA